MVDKATLPRWLPMVNRLVITLQRLGLAIGTMHLISIPGRKSGLLRTTPVSPLTVDRQRYIVAGLSQADWVKNARAAGWGILSRGRTQEPVALVELPPDERGPILREFPRRVPHGVHFFQRLYGVSADPEAFVALAPHCPVFRVEPVPTDGLMECIDPRAS